ncbi:hypothetical protein N7457_009704 [Penicillium paradoxum]|uniref:uncharacterized protein n=1 Tax=Penicillium paradoxum TaxID=176176 RepID=UPI002547BDED|nr:uncharacterized protein N7457_009704 [Penicillium paradoxum]KAJ5774808.1 hypothetical protein N7457_009704 [Penicillium paradoxum]
MEAPQASRSLKATVPSLVTLPSELHIQLSSYLCYPDALALKHSSRQFYYLVYTGVRLKVDWLVERFERRLECPMEKCSFITDESFCNGRVRRIMERRRWHHECRRVKGGCMVVYGTTCRTGFMPVWVGIKAQARRKAARIVGSWGQEALLMSLITVFLQILWYLFQRVRSLDNEGIPRLLIE